MLVWRAIALPADYSLPANRYPLPAKIMRMTRRSNSTDYGSYITSPAWRNKHAGWLKKAGHRCSMFPWVSVGKTRGKYHRYEMHHTHYKTLGNERFWVDVIVLCPLAHWVIHRVLGGADRVRHQKSPYPNTLQRTAHAWCRLPVVLKGGMAIGVVWGVAEILVN